MPLVALFQKAALVQFGMLKDRCLSTLKIPKHYDYCIEAMLSQFNFFIEIILYFKNVLLYN